MIKIIEHGTRKEQRCEKCGCLFSYEAIDVEKGNVATSAYCMEPYKIPFKYVRCPQCNNEIILHDEYLENEDPETDCCKWFYGAFNNKWYRTLCGMYYDRKSKITAKNIKKGVCPYCKRKIQIKEY